MQKQILEKTSFKGRPESEEAACISVARFREFWDDSLVMFDIYYGETKNEGQSEFKKHRLQCSISTCKQINSMVVTCEKYPVL